MTLVVRACLNCGAEFSVKPERLNRGRGKYCSRSCSSSGTNKKRVGAANANWKGGVSADNYRYKMRFVSKSPEKARAHKLVAKAIERGDISRQPCAHCGGLERIQAHHDDYSKPLEVVWLCQICHIRHHHRLRTSLNT